MQRKRIVVRGQVQGVFFRDSCRQEAVRHGVSGWVRNRPDGTVEAVFEGEAGAVEHMVAWARRGPGQASVEGIDVQPERPEGVQGFSLH